MRNTWPLLKETDFPAIKRRTLTTLQMNLGYLCNLACLHCHVSAGPTRKELMDKETMQLALDVAKRYQIQTLDVTGGSPEMNPHFRWLVEQARAANINVMDRLNPTIMMEPGYEWVGPFLAKHQIEIVASMPCYSKENVDAQRGNGVFEASITALQQLNELGYAKPGTGLTMNLVYNPLGPTLPPDQNALEADYKRLLMDEFGIEFNQLYTMANMPIQRFGAILLAKGDFEHYMNLLKDSYQRENLQGVMCRDLISVDYQGYLYDCDFNQMLKLPLDIGTQDDIGSQDADLDRPHLKDLLIAAELPSAIRIADHCYGCTAGQGSSCGGALS